MTLPQCILFVDDDADDQDFFCEATGLLDPSIKRLIASDGAAALQLLDKADALLPDLIFLDINMPIMDGIECLEAIKKMEKLSRVPVIMCSTSAFSGDQETCEKLGADFYLIKPATLVKMVSSLQFIFSRYSSDHFKRAGAKPLAA